VYNQPYQPSFGQPVQSQYRGFQKQFQPTGYVQSFYNTQQPSGMMANPQAQNYHMQNYAGYRQDHDAYLREDSLNPSSYAAGRSQSFNTFQPVQSQFGRVNVPTSQYVQNTGFQQQINPSSYHLPNYAGDRQDHDAYLREDSMRPSSYAASRVQGSYGRYSSF
jgi:hypothetical protein